MVVARAFVMELGGIAAIIPSFSHGGHMGHIARYDPIWGGPVVMPTRGIVGRIWRGGACHCPR